MKYYLIILVLFIYFIFNKNCNIIEYLDKQDKSEKKPKKKPEKRLALPDDDKKAFMYATEQICLKNGYGFDGKTCTHISRSTCIRDHPGFIANKEDVELANKYKDSPCIQQLESFNPIRAEVGEWLKASEADKKRYKDLQKKVLELHNIHYTKPTRTSALNLFKAETKLNRAERDSIDRCQYSDQSFKHWCIKQKLKYVPDKSGVGKCIITENYCKSKIMNYDPAKKECVKKDSTAEAMFGATMVRKIQAGSVSDDVYNCKASPCYKDEWCAGSGICKPITNPGQSCWSGHDEACWCKSTCSTPMNSQKMIAIGNIVGAVVAAIAAAVLIAVAVVACAPCVAAGAAIAAKASAAAAAASAAVASTSAGSAAIAAAAAAKASIAAAGAASAAAIGTTAAGAAALTAGAAVVASIPALLLAVSVGLLTTAATMAAGALAVRATQLSTEAARCGAGKDGINIPGGKNGDENYLALGQGGCCSWYSCPPAYYCPIGHYPCRPAKDPGGVCMAGQHNWCKGESKCILTAAGTAKCSAGKDGLRPVGTNYKTIHVKQEKLPPNPRIEKLMKRYGNLEEVTQDKSLIAAQGMVRPPKQVDLTKKEVFDFHNGDEHYMKLGEAGCSVAISCPPGYYCSGLIGEPCQKAKPPGSYCLAFQDNWCKGTSKCMSNSRCSCGKDGVNAPGPLYYKDKDGKDIPEKGMIYDNGSTNYTCLNSTNCNMVDGPPPGYYCKLPTTYPKLTQQPGSSCLAGQSTQCIGESSCQLSFAGGKCSAGEDGINPPGTLRKTDIPEIVEEVYDHKNKKGEYQKGLKIKYDKRFIGEDKILNKQIGNNKFIKLKEIGCAAGAPCPSHVKKEKDKDNVWYSKEGIAGFEAIKEKDTEHYYCSGLLGETCKRPKEAGKYCLLENWCKQGHCTGGTCSTKLDNQWYVPIDGRCNAFTDSCEPDTYCDPASFTCKFGKPN